MKHWQRERNYRKYENADGVIIHVITVDGEDVEVSAEVYAAYSKADRRERYIRDEVEKDRILPLNRLEEDYMDYGLVESAEETAVRNLLTEQIRKVLQLLDGDERELVRRLYFEGVSIRAYARQKGLSDFAIRHRERKVLTRLKNFLMN